MAAAYAMQSQVWPPPEYQGFQPLGWLPHEPRFRARRPEFRHAEQRHQDWPWLAYGWLPQEARFRARRPELRHLERLSQEWAFLPYGWHPSQPPPAKYRITATGVPQFQTNWFASVATPVAEINFGWYAPARPYILPPKAVQPDSFAWILDYPVQLQLTMGWYIQPPVLRTTAPKPFFDSLAFVSYIPDPIPPYVGITSLKPGITQVTTKVTVATTITGAKTLAARVTTDPANTDPITTAKPVLGKITT